MAGRFEGRVAVITGGGRGIGRDTALLFAREGARVVVSDLGGEVRGGGSDASVAQAVVDEIKAAGGEAVANSADVATMPGAKSVIEDAMDSFGSVDVLFNGAGILRTGLIDKMEEELWDQIIRVNLKSAYAMSHYAAPHMIDQRTGSIISVSSPSGFGHYAMAAYATTKEGLVAFTRCLARDLGQYGVRSNIIRPCAPTRMLMPEIIEDMNYVLEELGVTPVGGQWFPGMNGEEPECSTENVAAVIAWLSSPETEPLNGRVIYIAGGHVALVAEPELIRSRYNAKGWDLDSLLSPSVVAQFTYDQRNHFPARN
jgi:NAD(P)-dependent dehydrogenase (short-subunit alcohol dehydrogenase family)